MTKLNKTGFTIIELLIATVVFAVVLLIVTTGIVQFGRIYYKGIIQSRTQERARAIVEDISQNLQFSGTAPSFATSGGYSYRCIGGRAYTYKLNIQQTGTQHVLVADNPGICGAYGYMLDAIPAGSTAQELVGENMQLLKLNVVQTTTNTSDALFTVTVRLAYGNTADMNDTNSDGIMDSCKQTKLGGQFCAISELQSTVTRRLK